MVCLLQWGEERVEYRCGATSKVKDVVKHHFIHLSHHPSIDPSGHPSILSWSVYSDGAKKYRRSAAGKCTIKYTHTCALGTGCIHLSRHPSSIRPVMVCLLWRGGEIVELAPTNAPIGCSVHGMGCISSSSRNHSTFFNFWPMSFFWAVFFSTLTFIVPPHLEYNTKEEEKRERKVEEKIRTSCGWSKVGSN